MVRSPLNFLRRLEGGSLNVNLCLTLSVSRTSMNDSSAQSVRGTPRGRSVIVLEK